MPATVAAVIAVAYAAYSSVGTLVFGFLGGYAKEEGLTSGSRYFLLELAQKITGLHDLTTTYTSFCAATFAAIYGGAGKLPASRQAISSITSAPVETPDSLPPPSPLPHP